MNDFSTNINAKERILLDELLKFLEELDPFLKIELKVEEKITLGYFLAADVLYNGWNYVLTSREDYKIANKEHQRLLNFLYPEDSVLNPEDVIDSLITKKLLKWGPDRSWTSNRKNYHYHPPKLEINDELVNQLNPKFVSKIKNKIIIRLYQ